MSGFSESAMRKHLSSLSGTMQSIQTLSLWLLHHQKRHSDVIVQIWLEEMKKEIRPNRIVNMLHLANDVIQNSRKQCPGFKDMFYVALESALRHLSLHADSEAVHAVQKVVRVFRERQIYPKARIDALVSAMATSLNRALLVLLTQDDKSAITDVVDIMATPSTSASTPPVISDRLNSPPFFSLMEESLADCSTSKEESEEIDEGQLEKVTHELLDNLKKLIDPASADASTRQLIATFPEVISDVSLLQRVKNEEETRDVLAKIDGAEPIIKSYCERLAAELDCRETLLRQLSEFHGYLKRSIKRDNQLIVEADAKLRKYEEEKSAISKHLESLPDLSMLPPQAFAPLPSFSELFENDSNDPAPDTESK